MGTFKWIPLWVLLGILASVNVQGHNEDDNSISEQQENVLITGAPRKVMIPLPTSLSVKSFNAAHNNRVCSTWGNFHFKNFDGDLFYFPGTCNYVYASHCQSAYEDFNIQIRRTVVDNVSLIEKISMKLDGLDVQIDSNTVIVGGQRVQLPYGASGVQIEKYGVYLTVTSKLGLTFMWNDDDSLLLELDAKYANSTCGLCGDFNGISMQNEFVINGVQITAEQFGNMQKLDGPTELCTDVSPIPKSNCTDNERICESVLLGSAFSSCHSLMAVEQYIEACIEDLCRCDSKTTPLCLCDTFAEYSRQCAHAGGYPENWRTEDLCSQICPYNMEYQECGSQCADTCTNPDRAVLCEKHCMEGCVCPAGTVYDDINNSGCVPLEQCACIFNSTSYSPGTSYSTPCSTCVCTGARWQCENKPCPASCSVEGGCHIATYDQTHYTFNGDCDYVLSRSSDGDSFTILAEMRKCGLSDRSTCLKGTTMMLNGGETVIAIKPSGSVFVNNMYTQLPVSAANVTIFQPSSFYIIVQYRQGIRADVQLTPLMQVSVSLDPSYKGQTCGLCGNFNDRQADDFQTISGAIEGTATSFANTWKTRGSCDNVKNVYEDPCSFSVENEQYANYWCGLISDPSGPFSPCHAMVNPDMYKKNCMFDTCNCERSEDCMCAALSSYVRVCATKGILLTGWRSTVCSKYMDTCPKTMIYTYATNTCQPTCRSLSEPDVTCSINFVHVDGCVCPKDYYLDDTGACVPVSACPCYYKGSAVPAGEVVHDNGILCTCTLGKLSCIGTIEDCTAPMVYVNCKNATSDTQGAECQKSCQTLDMACYGAACVPGCVCPDGLVSDGKGGCIKEEDCPCIHNDAAYQPGDEIKVKCNTCICKERMWQCTDNPCLGTCTVYGDGNYITFDGQHYKFNGNCEYTLAQDYHDQTGNSSRFRVLTENIPCGTTGTTCSKSIKIFQGSYELILADENFKVEERAMEERAMDGFVPYKVTNMGIHLVIEINQGLTLVWDKKTTIFIKLSKDFEGQISGLCGNYDGNGMNDFTTRSRSVVADVFEFANSWRISQSCPDAQKPRDACSVNPYRKVWAQKQCSILNSQVFSTCHAQVDPSMYYEACVSDSCACDSGGDCECFCTAVAAYARACGEAGVCVSWRTPNICPIFCDYYNPKGECEWHYKACGSPCLKTCRNPTGKCKHELGALEGCYPSCPASKPYFDEDEMKCVAQCDCYDDAGNHFQVGDPVPTFENCQTCVCGLAGTECEYQKEACRCEYNGKMYKFNQVIYRKEDDTGGCYTAICEEKGIITKNIYSCPEATTSTPSTRTTRTETITATTTPTTETTSTTILESTGTKSDTTSETTENTCFCHVNHKLFSPGQIIYNKTIEAGCFFYAVCNDACESDEFIGPCPHTIETTTPKPEPETSATTTAVVPTTSVEGCPPKKTNEVWINDKCEEVTCYGNNITIHRPMKCPELQPLTCANGFPPVTTKSEDGCCDQLECQCVCTGWGSTHYTTFNGAYYTFQDNCTYVLVKEITPRHDFQVHVDNYFCDAADGPTCPQAILIYYKSNEIALTRNLYEGKINNMIRLNNEWVAPGFTKDGMTISSADININVEIPVINTVISFTGLVFSIKLPMSKFAYNTEGQCGTCSDNIIQECRMPDGRTVEDCSAMAAQWRISGKTPGCEREPTVTTVPPTSFLSTTTPPPTCSSSTLCNIILSEVFFKCHKLLPPKRFYDSCAFDACRVGKSSVLCSSLEVYASLCTANGICVDWRGKTGGLCPYNCPAGKVYNSCGPKRVNTCDNKLLESTCTAKTEGCYCPEGKILFNAYTDICVQSCACVGPDGMPKSPGETWNITCKTCVCETNSLTVQCQPISCPKLQPITCTKEGFIPVTTANPNQPCCLQNQCQCNTSYCVKKVVTCANGLKAVPVLLQGDCCPTYTCKPVDVCIVNDKVYQTNQTWQNNKCELVTCYGNNVTINKPVTCPAVQPPNCINGFPSDNSKTADGCCDVFECQCVCSGWGDPHYITFDGVYYTFQDNCTYVLVQEINPKYSNFRVLVDNYYCAAADGLSCPQSIFIYYKSNEIMLTRMLNNREMKNMIRLNNQWVTPGFTTDGIIITSIGINMNVEIPEIGAYISFSGLIFMIKLPFSKFAYNTEGQCGTCSNNIDDECRMPGGRMEKDCTSMAPYWRVNSTTPGCVPKPPVPSTSTSTTTTSTTISSTSTTTTTKSSTSTSTTTKSSTSTTTKSSTPTSTTTKSSTSTSTTTKTPICSSSFLCDIILSNVFVKCHKVIPPKPYYDGCLYDACRIRNDSVPCSSLEVYASLCSINGICVDWRGTTGGRCPYNCSTGKVYKPCGPIRVNTCENKLLESTYTGQIEGCFCPDGTTLFNTYTDTCVKSCACVGPDGMPKAPGETWTSGCKTCTCETMSLTVQCQQLPCPKLEPIICTKEGFISVTRTDPKQPCCMKNECQCNSTYCVTKEKTCSNGQKSFPVVQEGCDINSCVTKEKTCPVGYQVVSELLKDDCCPTFSCRPLKVCVVNDIAYQPGQSIPQSSNSCQTCACTEDKDPKSEFNLVKCSTTPCNKDCAQGFQYREVPERCCGRCVQVECTMKLETNEIITIKPGEIWSPPDELCLKYQCNTMNDHFVAVEVKETCSVESCEVGYEYQRIVNECCGKCVKVACAMAMPDNSTVVIKPGDIYIPPEDKCISYECTSMYNVVAVRKTCPAFNPKDCLEGTIKRTDDGCCKTCEPILSGCQIQKQSRIISSGTCETNQVVEHFYCDGGCMTSSKYSDKANIMEHTCSCCQETKTSKRQVTLHCLDGTSTVYTYLDAIECGCTITECPNSQYHDTESNLRPEV